jgi:cell fate regulator YaaT (PSP1 superfamily)
VRKVVGVVFNEGGKLYQFAADDVDVVVGEQVVVFTAKGHTIGKVVKASEELDETSLPPGLKSVVRVAGEADQRQMEANRALEARGRELCLEFIEELGLKMKVVSVESSFDQSKLTFCFFADDRVDFRNLVSRLSDRLKKRVELRQISARDQARLIGGYGPCGRRLCCALFAGDQEPVSIRMAKDQNLPLNPSKISGVCGRLMCCLKYERDTYVHFRERAPRKGAVVSTPAGEGRVVELLAPRESVLVDLGDGHSVMFTLAELGLDDQESTHDE